jgi:hypothetical protein
MAKKAKKPASKLTTDEVMERLFGRGAAKKARRVLAAEDARKPQKKRGK